MIAGDCSKSWRMHWKRLDRQAFFFDRRELSFDWILVLERRLYVEVFLMATLLFR